jgi:hypothetical protein
MLEVTQDVFFRIYLGKKPLTDGSLPSLAGKNEANYSPSSVMDHTTPKTSIITNITNHVSTCWVEEQ